MNYNFTIATLATLLSVGSLAAQEVAPGKTQARVQPTNQISSTNTQLSKDQVLAKCLAITNEEQVTLARFAQEQSTSEEVKELATTLEKAHQECVVQLKALATKTASSKKPEAPALTAANNASSAANNNSTAANNNSTAVDFLQIHQEISAQCIQDSKEMLSKKKGAEFDACFVGMQVAKHGMMHSTLTVFERHTKGELRDLIKSSIVKNDEHMQAASNLMEQLSAKAVTKTASAR